MKISISEVQKALKDPNFRKSLPEELKSDLQKYDQNPNCPCNYGIYKNVLKFAGSQLKSFFPGGDVVIEEEKLPQNQWGVINCHINELEEKLKGLPPGRKQVAVARYLDQITVIVNELDIPL